jgi:hypothetical protein
MVEGWVEGPALAGGAGAFPHAVAARSNAAIQEHNAVRSNRCGEIRIWGLLPQSNGNAGQKAAGPFFTGY